MYFKIENKESQLYKDVMTFIETRRVMKISNMDSAKSAIHRLTGMKYNKDYKLMVSSCGFYLIDNPSGVKLEDGIETPKGLKFNKTRGIICPDGRTKIGKELIKIFDKLPNIRTEKILEVLGVEDKFLSRSKFPYLEEFDGVVIALVDSQLEPKSTDDFIEITESAFYKIYNKD